MYMRKASLKARLNSQRSSFGLKQVSSVSVECVRWYVHIRFVCIGPNRRSVYQSEFSPHKPGKIGTTTGV